MKKSRYLTKTNYAIAAALSAFALSTITKQGIKHTYKFITGKPAPQNPEDKNAKIKEVILFSLALGISSAIVKTLGRKYFARKWAELNGELPEHLS